MTLLLPVVYFLHFCSNIYKVYLIAALASVGIAIA